VLRPERSTSAVWTVGHSRRPLAEFLAVLAAYDIELVADVRRYPGSRGQPQYQQRALELALEAEGIAYTWLPSLGGRRRPAPESRNTGWRHPAFRGYADHIDTEEFAEGLFELMAAAFGLRTAIMCAEILWWRCHRRLIADVLVSLNVEVIHILDHRTAQLHRLAEPARLSRGVLSYVGATSGEPFHIE
jgi:uncharacterized protein (DUF488 family)